MIMYAVSASERSIGRRLFSLREIVATERTYADSLKLLQKGFIEPAPMSEDEKKQLFAPLDPIREWHLGFASRLEAALKQREESPERAIGTCFRRMIELQIPYRSYASHYPKLLKSLEGLKQTMQTEEHVLRNTVVSFCILPVQRPPRYMLLLKEVLKHTPVVHSDYKALKNAMTTARMILDVMNMDEHNFEQAVAIARPISPRPSPLGSASGGLPTGNQFSNSSYSTYSGTSNPTGRTSPPKLSTSNSWVSARVVPSAAAVTPPPAQSNSDRGPSAVSPRHERVRADALGRMQPQVLLPTPAPPSSAPPSSPAPLVTPPQPAPETRPISRPFSTELYALAAPFQPHNRPLSIATSSPMSATPTSNAPVVNPHPNPNPPLATTAPSSAPSAPLTAPARMSGSHQPVMVTRTGPAHFPSTPPPPAPASSGSTPPSSSSLAHPPLALTASGKLSTQLAQAASFTTPLPPPPVTSPHQTSALTSSYTKIPPPPSASTSTAQRLSSAELAPRTPADSPKPSPLALSSIKQPPASSSQPSPPSIAAAIPPLVATKLTNDLIASLMIVKHKPNASPATNPDDERPLSPRGKAIPGPALPQADASPPKSPRSPRSPRGSPRGLLPLPANSSPRPLSPRVVSSASAFAMLPLAKPAAPPPSSALPPRSPSPQQRDNPNPNPYFASPPSPRPGGQARQASPLPSSVTLLARAPSPRPLPKTPSVPPIASAAPLPTAPIASAAGRPASPVPMRTASPRPVSPQGMRPLPAPPGLPAPGHVIRTVEKLQQLAEEPPQPQRTSPQRMVSPQRQRAVSPQRAPDGRV